MTHSFQQLEDDHGVCARMCARMNHKFSLNYDQILVKNGDSVAEECRGMVIRANDLDICPSAGDAWKDVVVGEVDIIAWPMNRFYNHGQDCGATVDWSDSNLRVYEKLDGTMIVMYWDEHYKQWLTGTRSVPEADLPICKDHISIGNTTFSGLFWTALEKTYDSLCGDVYDFCGWLSTSFDKDVTYVFELTSQFNRIVVQYNVTRATLLAARGVKTGIEIPIESINIPFIQKAASWSIKEPVALATFIDSADPAKLEGAVVCDSHFRRLKIKNKAWVMSSRAKNMVMVSPRNALEYIILGKLDDVIPLVEKDIGDKLLRMQYEFLKYCKSIDANFAEWAAEAAGSRKRFAELVMIDRAWGAPYFNLWEKKATDARSLITKMANDGKLSSSSLDIILSKFDH